MSERGQGLDEVVRALLAEPGATIQHVLRQDRPPALDETVHTSDGSRTQLDQLINVCFVKQANKHAQYNLGPQCIPI